MSNTITQLEATMKTAQAARDAALRREYDTLNTGAPHDAAVKALNTAQDRHMAACNAYYAARDAAMTTQDKLNLALGYLRVGMMSNDTGLRIKAEQAIAVLTQITE